MVHQKPPITANAMALSPSWLSEIRTPAPPILLQPLFRRA